MGSVLWVVWSRIFYPGALKPGFLFHQTMIIFFPVLVFLHKIFSYYERPLSNLSPSVIHDSAVLSITRIQDLPHNSLSQSLLQICVCM